MQGGTPLLKIYKRDYSTEISLQTCPNGNLTIRNKTYRIQEQVYLSEFFISIF